VGRQTLALFRQKITGEDPDFKRRDLWDASDSGQYPDWET
jgi:catalase